MTDRLPYSPLTDAELSYRRDEATELAGHRVRSIARRDRTFRPSDLAYLLELGDQAEAMKAALAVRLDRS